MDNTQTAPHASRPRPFLPLLDLYLAVLTALASLLVYILTLTPSLSYLSPDGSELATVPYILGLAHSPGYPLYTWLGFLFSHLLPFGDVAHRVNLMSAVMGAMGVGGLYLITILVFPAPLSALKRAAAAFGALLFAFSTDFWSQSVIAEVYAPNLGMLALTLLALLIWARSRNALHYLLFALLFGLSLGTHLSNLGFAPAFALFTLLVLFSDRANATPLSEGKAWKDRLREIIKLLLAGSIGFILGALQFVWLPLRSNSLNDRAMLRSAPSNLASLYRYTLGAFQNFRFAFPLLQLPDRLVIYLDLLRQQFGLVGIVLGIAGLFALLFTRPRRFFLLVAMYLVNVWFFIQYRAFDLEVFFIPAHFLWAIFLAFGAWILAEGVLAMFTRLFSGVRLTPAIANLLLAIIVLGGSLFPLSANWSGNDFSHDTAINDFYANLWERLPEGGVLLTSGGVFGFDAFYWRLIYNTRPDVFLPTLSTPDPSPHSLGGKELYATIPALEQRGPGALPRNILDRDLWQIPVLFGEQPEAQIGRRSSLVLFHLSSTPPQLVVENPQPQLRLDANLSAAALIGADLAPSTVESGSSLLVSLYWRMDAPRPVRVETRLGDQVLEQHEIGLGLLPRYAIEVGIPDGAVIREQFWLVIPSNTSPGERPFSLSLIYGGRGGDREIILGNITVINEMETVQRWLQIARLVHPAPLSSSD
jgi:hypothetical protein